MLQLASLPAFVAAQCVKVNPDTPQKQVRFLTLNGTISEPSFWHATKQIGLIILESLLTSYLPLTCFSGLN